MDDLAWYYHYFSIFGVGVHVLIAVFFAIHALRTGRPFFWLWILFVFPFLGSVVYFIAEYLPQSRMTVNANKFGKMAINILQPNKLLKQAKENYENLPSIENTVHYAEFLIVRDRAIEAVEILKQKLNSFVENDPAYLEKLALAHFYSDQFEDLLKITKKINSIDINFKAEKISLMNAIAYDKLNEQVKAKEQFLVATRSRNVEYLFEYALWAIRTDQLELVVKIKAEMEKNWAIGNKHSKKLYKPYLKKLNQQMKQLDTKRGPKTSFKS